MADKFDSKSTQRIAKVVKAVEKEIKHGFGSGTPTNSPRGGGGGGRIGKTFESSGIDAISGDEPGVATVYWYVFNGTILENSGSTFTVYNSAGAVPADTFIQCKRIGAYWWVDVSQCSEEV